MRATAMVRPAGVKPPSHGRPEAVRGCGQGTPPLECGPEHAPCGNHARGGFGAGHGHGDCPCGSSNLYHLQKGLTGLVLI